MTDSAKLYTRDISLTLHIKLLFAIYKQDQSL